MDELDDAEVRALRRTARLATLDAIRSLGGEAQRRDILERAKEHAAFSARQRQAPPPATAVGRHATRLDYELAWTLTNLKRDGLVTNPARGTWALAGQAAVPDAPPLAAPVVLTRLEQLRSMPYRLYLRSPEWRETRGSALVRAGHACSLDATHTDRLEVHHRTCERLGEERPEDVVVLCAECHRHHHRLVGRPKRRERVAVSVAPPGRAETRPGSTVPAGWSEEPVATERAWLRRLLR